MHRKCSEERKGRLEKLRKGKVFFPFQTYKIYAPRLVGNLGAAGVITATPPSMTSSRIVQHKVQQLQIRQYVLQWRLLCSGVGGGWSCINTCCWARIFTFHFLKRVIKNLISLFQEMFSSPFAVQWCGVHQYVLLSAAFHLFHFLKII